MSDSAFVTGLWRNIAGGTEGNNPGFQFTGSPTPDPTYGRGYELTAGTLFDVAHGVEWMIDPATGQPFPYTQINVAALVAAFDATGLSGDDQVIGSDANDHLETGAGNDTVYGRMGDDFIDGGDGDDQIFGQEGNDTLRGGAGNDFLNGGAGTDVALFSGLMHQYGITGTADSRIVASPADAQDTLVDIERLSFADGRLVFDDADPAAVALRLYDAAFNRTPDAQELNTLANLLSDGAKIEDVASTLIGSSDFPATANTVSNDAFVRQIYKNILDHDGDSAGIRYWTTALDQRQVTRGTVLASLSEAPEHQDLMRPQVQAGLFVVDETAAQVARLYGAAVNRLPDAPGLLYWLDTVKSGQHSLGDVADLFVKSAEFSATYGTLSDKDYVEQIYRNVLDRAPETAGTQFWVSYLADGTHDRGDVLLGFSDSAEFRTQTSHLIDDGILFV
jgi:hypothetical protein